MIHLLRSHATQEQLTAMLEELTEYVKLAVEILDPAIRDRVNVIVRSFFEGV